MNLSLPAQLGLHRLNPRTSIGGSLITGFLLIALLSAGVLGWMLYGVSSRSLEATYREKLNLVALRKSEALEGYANELLRSVRATGRTETTVAIVRELEAALAAGGPESEAYLQLAERQRRALAPIAALYDFPEMVLVSGNGTVVFSLNPRLAGLQAGASLTRGPLADSELGGVFERVRTLLQEEISDYAIYPGMKDPAAFAAGPVMDDNSVAGMLLVQLSNAQIRSIVTESAGLGETGETMAGIRVGEEIALVAPLRHDAAAPFENRLPAVGDSALQRAVRGQHGYGIDPDYRGVESLQVWTFAPSFRWGLVIKQDTREAFALIDAQRRTTIGLLALLILPVGLAAWLLARTVSRPIVLAAQAAAEVANGDLKLQPESIRKDEAGVLLRALATMVLNLRTLIGQVKRSSVQLTSTAAQLSFTASKQESSVADFSSSTSQIAAAVHEISATGQELVTTMAEVARRIEETAGLADAGRSSLTGLEETVTELATSTQGINARLQAITEQAHKIGGVILTISKVADQTNLLSLNAAIEAEKAGDYGHGFAVVAREIRRLADQTAVGALDIERMIGDMQSAVGAGVRDMARFSEQVARGVEASADTNRQLERIIVQVEALTPRFAEVNHGMQSQALGAQQISSAMLQLREVAGATASSVDDLLEATRQTEESVDQLRLCVSKFRTEDAEQGTAP